MSLSPHVYRRRLRPLAAGLLSIGVLAIVFGVFATPWRFIGVSMASTLEPGEILLADRVGLDDLARGEVIIFEPPVSGQSDAFVKRVIGLPGDVIAIHDGCVYVNGRRLQEPYLSASERTTTQLPDYTIIVPRGSVFVLGDNRSVSWDSRAFGPVPLGSVLGRAWLAISLSPVALRMP